MRCTNHIATQLYGNKQSKTRMVRTRPEWILDPTPAWIEANKNLVPSVAGNVWSPCPGMLKIRITCHDGSEYDSAGIDVNFECSYCGPSLFGKGLPSMSGYDLDDWVNALMDRVDVMPFRDMHTAETELTEVRNALTAKILAEKTGEDKNLERAERNSYAEACLRIMRFKEKRQFKKDPDWNVMTMEIAKTGGLL